MRRLGLDEPWTGSAASLVDEQDLRVLPHVATVIVQAPRGPQAPPAHPPLRSDLHIDRIPIAQDRKMSDTLLGPGDKGDTLPYSRPVTPDHGRRVGVYGLGAIGYHVARNLANTISSLPVVVYNRTTAKSEKLAGELGPNKISVAQSPAELVDSCDIMCGLFILKLTRSLICRHQLYNSRER